MKSCPSRLGRARWFPADNGEPLSSWVDPAFDDIAGQEAAVRLEARLGCLCGTQMVENPYREEKFPCCVGWRHAERPSHNEARWAERETARKAAIQQRREKQKQARAYREERRAFHARMMRQAQAYRESQERERLLRQARESRERSMDGSSDREASDTKHSFLLDYLGRPVR